MRKMWGIGLLMVAYAWQVPGAAPKVDPADVRAIELRGLVQEASEALPADTRSAIGLEGQPLATRKGVLANNGLPDDATAVKDAVRLNDLDSWQEFHADELK